MYDDKELKEYRDLLPTPDHFEEGFDWKTIIGAIFIGFLMMPGSMYLQLVIGQGIGPAARWVTIILFAEIAKRAHSDLKQQEIFLLYYMAGAALASPFSGLLWNQYLVQSDAARMLGVTEFIPSWVAPAADSVSMVERSFFHRDWLVPILLLVGSQIIQRIDHFGLGYALYRLTSDVEKLPFPMAPVAALGTMALAESAEEKKASWKWRVFSIGGVIGLAFGSIYVLLPIVSGLIFTEQIRLIPIPWIELTGYTEGFLPAVATGLQFDLGLVFVGMVLPFWAVIGGLIGLIITIILNPLLYSAGILHRWHPGMATVDTVFANNFDFYMSFGIGLGLAIAFIGVWSVIRSFRAGKEERGSLKDLFNPPAGRGDFNFWIAIGIYFFSTLAYVALCVWLVPSFPWVFFLAYGFVYTPIISYITARMEGIAGQFVSLPLVREASFIAGARFFGYQGIEIWYAPIPIHNYGEATVQFRQIELTGTSIRGIIKAELGFSNSNGCKPDILTIHLAPGPYPICKLPLCPGTLASAGLKYTPYADFHSGRKFNVLSGTGWNNNFFRPGFWCCNVRCPELFRPSYPAYLWSCAGPWPVNSPRPYPRSNRSLCRQILLHEKIRPHVAPICACPARGVFMRYGVKRYVRHGFCPHHEISWPYGLLTIREKLTCLCLSGSGWY